MEMLAVFYFSPWEYCFHEHFHTCLSVDTGARFCWACTKSQGHMCVPLQHAASILQCSATSIPTSVVWACQVLLSLINMWYWSLSFWPFWRVCSGCFPWFSPMTGEAFFTCAHCPHACPFYWRSGSSFFLFIYRSSLHILNPNPFTGVCALKSSPPQRLAFL